MQLSQYAPFSVRSKSTADYAGSASTFQKTGENLNSLRGPHLAPNIINHLAPPKIINQV